jgi:hypothetical protein
MPRKQSKKLSGVKTSSGVNCVGSNGRNVEFNITYLVIRISSMLHGI